MSVSQAVGYTCQFGSNTKPAQAGFAAKAGLICALLAEAGMTGQHTVLDSARGMNGLMGAGTAETFADMLSAMGKPPALIEHGLLLKPWPSCGYTHRLISCALALRDECGLDTEEIVSIRATMPDFHKAILPFSKPVNRNEALFSVEACLAQTLLHGNLTLADLDQRFWEHPQTVTLASRVNVRTESPLNAALNYDPQQPDRLEIRLRSSTKPPACTVPCLAARSKALCSTMI